MAADHLYPKSKYRAGALFVLRAYPETEYASYGRKTYFGTSIIFGVLSVWEEFVPRYN